MKAIFAKTVSKSDIKPELTNVLVSMDKLVATDSYTLIEVDHSCLSEEDRLKVEVIKGRREGNVMLKPEELDMKIDILKTMPIETGVDFPNYAQVIPTIDELDQHYSVIEVDPNYLANILNAVSKTFKSKQYRSIKLYVPKKSYDGTVQKGQDKVIVKRADNSVIGVVMPLHNDNK